MRRSLLLAAATLAAAAPAAVAMPDGHGPPDRPDRAERPDRSDRPDGPKRGSAPETSADRPAGDPVREKPPGGPVDGATDRSGVRDGAPEARGVRYLLTGVVVRNARPRAVRVRVLKANVHLKKSLPQAQAPAEAGDARPPVLRVRIGSDTVIVSKDGRRSQVKPRARQTERSGRVKPRATATHRALRKGDRVTVVWRAPAGLAAAKLPAATRIVDRGRKTGGGPSGAAFTTNHDGTAVNVNRYASADDVYLNGGPSCGAQRHAAALPDGAYYFQVTTANGREKLSTSPLAERRFVMKDSAVVSSSAPTNPLGCDFDGLVVQVAPFSASPNGVYKLWIAPAKKVRGGKFPPRVSKTDNFMIDANLDGDPDRPDDPDPDQDPPSDPDQDPPPPPDGGGQTF